MNFKEFQDNVHEMSIRIHEKRIPLEKVEIVHTKSTGANIIAAIYGENILDYFKW